MVYIAFAGPLAPTSISTGATKGSSTHTPYTTRKTASQLRANAMEARSTALIKPRVVALGACVVIRIILMTSKNPAAVAGCASPYGTALLPISHGLRHNRSRPAAQCHLPSQEL